MQSDAAIRRHILGCVSGWLAGLLDLSVLFVQALGT